MSHSPRTPWRIIFSLSVALAVLSIAARLTAQSKRPILNPTIYYLHGHIYTNDPKHPWADAMAVRDEKILCVGSISQIMLECGGAESEDVIQLKGSFVMPGFNDAHVHIGGAARDKLALVLNDATSVDDILKLVKDAAAKHPPGDWIVGSGWDQSRYPNQNFPTRLELDQAAPNNPVYLDHVSGHIAVANSLALKHAEITSETPNPPGGEIGRFADGEPNGLLKENATEMVEQRIPDPSGEERKKGITLVFEELARNGVTSVQDNSKWEDFLAYTELKQEKKLTVRITEWLSFLDSTDDLQNKRAQGGSTDPWLRTGALKGFIDGALGTHTAALLAPYSDDSSTSGMLLLDPEKLKALAIERDRLGFQIAFHAIGDKANRVALDTFESVLRLNPTRDRRDRIEHAQVVAPEDFPRFGKLQVIASMQPCHETNDMRWAEQRLGPERSKGAYAWKSLQDAGARLAFGTDYDVEPVNPLRGLYACVTREAIDGGPPGGWIPDQKLPLADCISAYTTGSAYAEFMDGKKGELKVGELADFIVLSQDLTKITPQEILKTQVLRTVVGGKTVFPKN
ncbi:MAG TPA: amidohydrolase [Candidatus Eremiobacteraceae bacterium]|nr:amidohydrolase [Candidatus Eremiobacteraceae bacterium]